MPKKQQVDIICKYYHLPKKYINNIVHLIDNDKVTFDTNKYNIDKNYPIGVYLKTFYGSIVGTDIDNHWIIVVQLNDNTYAAIDYTSKPLILKKYITPCAIWVDHRYQYFSKVMIFTNIDNFNQIFIEKKINSLTKFSTILTRERYTNEFRCKT